MNSPQEETDREERSGYTFFEHEKTARTRLQYGSGLAVLTVVMGVSAALIYFFDGSKAFTATRQDEGASTSERNGGANTSGIKRPASGGNDMANSN